MTMHISLLQEMESGIKSKVSAGFYCGAAEVNRDPMRHMQASDRENPAQQSAAPRAARPFSSPSQASGSDRRAP